MAIYSELSHWKWWCSIVMLVYQRVINKNAGIMEIWWDIIVLYYIYIYVIQQFVRSISFCRSSCRSIPMKLKSNCGKPPFLDDLSRGNHGFSWFLHIFLYVYVPLLGMGSSTWVVWMLGSAPLEYNQTCQWEKKNQEWRFLAGNILHLNQSRSLASFDCWYPDDIPMVIPMVGLIATVVIYHQICIHSCAA